MIPDPATARPRSDLPFLRRRTRPRPASSTTAEFFNGQARRPPRRDEAAGPTAPIPAARAPGHTPPRPATSPPATSPPAPSGSLDLDAPSAPPPPPAPSGSLDLDAPATTSPARPTTRLATSGGGIDYRRPGHSGTSGALDLDGGRSAPGAAPQPQALHARAAQDLRVPAVVRVPAHGQRIIGVRAPTVTLTRIQSGVGTLGIEVVTSEHDLRIGCAYELVSGATSTVQLADGNRFAPPSSRRPVIVAHREDGAEQLTFDLRQNRELCRAVVYAFSPSGASITWTGTLIVDTLGGGRVELPLENVYPGTIAVLVSIVNAGGELWIRAEMETIAGSIRDACRTYGFDRITWRDERTPAD